ncbi:MAG: 2-oxoacid:acceptor oxidoreductase family protein [Nitrososphaerales archaeon]
MSKLIELRFHGRGGQGVATAAELFVRAAAYDNWFVQSTPFFGAERRGALVAAYARVSDSPIWLREPVYNPDIVVVFDQRALSEAGVLDGLKTGGKILVNSNQRPEEIKHNIGEEFQLFIVDATGISMEHLKRPIVNTTLLGALASITDLTSLEALRRAILYRFPKIDIEATMRAVEEASRKVVGTYLS